MNKQEIIDEYVKGCYKKIEDMHLAYRGLNGSDRKTMESGYIFAVQSGVAVLNNVLSETHSVSKEQPKEEKGKQMGSTLERAGKDVMKFLTG